MSVVERLPVGEEPLSPIELRRACSGTSTFSITDCERLKPEYQPITQALHWIASELAGERSRGDDGRQR